MFLPVDHLSRIFSALRIWLKGNLVNPKMQDYKARYIQELGEIRKKGNRRNGVREEGFLVSRSRFNVSGITAAGGYCTEEEPGTSFACPWHPIIVIRAHECFGLSHPQAALGS